MHLMLVWRGIRWQSGRRRDTHSMAVAQLLHKELDGGQVRDASSLHSFWWPVHGEGAEQELCENQATFSVSCQPGEHFQVTMEHPATAPQSSREQRQWQGWGWAVDACPQLGEASVPALPKNCPEPWGHLSPARQLCFCVRLRLEHPLRVSVCPQD